MKTVVLGLAVFMAVVSAPINGLAKQRPFDRLPAAVLDVVPPSDRIIGAPGEMRIRPVACGTLPLSGARRRLVDIAVQEWGFFSFSVVDERVDRPRGRRRRGRGNPEESARVAASIGGYWAVTPEGPWIVENQNNAWNGPRGVGSRWRSPWSAAFISWLMCAGGVGDTGQFRRAVAHHTYIDQAIRARGYRHLRHGICSLRCRRNWNRTGRLALYCPPSGLSKPRRTASTDGRRRPDTL